jgi:hypothetical protein
MFDYFRIELRLFGYRIGALRRGFYLPVLVPGCMIGADLSLHRISLFYCG